MEKSEGFSSDMPLWLDAFLLLSPAITQWLTLIVITIAAWIAYRSFRTAQKAAADRSQAEIDALRAQQEATRLNVEAEIAARKSAQEAMMQRAAAEQKSFAKRNTYEIMLKLTADDDLIESMKAVNKARRDNTFFDLFQKVRSKGKSASAIKKRDEAVEDLNKIIIMLNFYEMVAIGIEDGIFDADSFKKWWRSTYIQTFIAAKTYITEARKDSNQLYVNYEKQCLKWAYNDEKKQIDPTGA